MKYLKPPPWQALPIIAGAGAFLLVVSLSHEADAGEPHGLTLPISAPANLASGTLATTTSTTVSMISSAAYCNPLPVIAHQVLGSEFWLHQAMTPTFLERPAFYSKPPDETKS
jgi:hypothetical protein